jgi:hypothetical protein
MGEAPARDTDLGPARSAPVAVRQGKAGLVFQSVPGVSPIEASSDCLHAKGYWRRREAPGASGDTKGGKVHPRSIEASLTRLRISPPSPRVSSTGSKEASGGTIGRQQRQADRFRCGFRGRQSARISVEIGSGVAWIGGVYLDRRVT